MRAKSLVYDADSYGKTGLCWMDDKANMRKATPEEIRSYEMLHPNEAIPVCQTTYYEQDENERWIFRASHSFHYPVYPMASRNNPPDDNRCR